MDKFDINSASLQDLKKLEKNIVRAIADFDYRQKRMVMSALEEKAKEFGFVLSDLFSHVAVTSTNPREKSTARYGNPSDPKMTWSGRGRKPRWFNEAIAAGTSPESMAV